MATTNNNYYGSIRVVTANTEHNAYNIIQLHFINWWPNYPGSSLETLFPEYA